MGWAGCQARLKIHVLAISVKISLLQQAFLDTQCTPFPQAACFLKPEESQAANSSTFHLKVLLQAGHVWAALFSRHGLDAHHRPALLRAIPLQPVKHYSFAHSLFYLLLNHKTLSFSPSIKKLCGDHGKNK